jgi:hypothetical protein
VGHHQAARAGQGVWFHLYTVVFGELLERTAAGDTDYSRGAACSDELISAMRSRIDGTGLG